MEELEELEGGIGNKPESEKSEKVSGKKVPDKILDLEFRINLGIRKVSG